MIVNIEIDKIKSTIISNINSNKPIEKTKIIVAMSGGVDSSTIASILKEIGYDIIGVTMLLYNSQRKENEANEKSCCGIRDINDARNVSYKFGFPHYTLDYREKFKKYVIDYFIEEYKQGKTPIPCLMCNQEIKFKYLMSTLDIMSADYLVTGHYAIIEKYKNEYILKRGKDMQKDQSYFLFSIPKKLLEKIRFPIGMFQKTEVRNVAQKINLSIHNKKESQDICFIENNKYRDFLSSNNVKSEAGNILDINGNIIGQHNGVHNFTIGQRRNLKIKNTPKPVYVIKIIKDNNEIIVGEKDYLYSSVVKIKNTNLLIDLEEIKNNRDILYAKIRSTQNRIMVKSIEINKNTATITLISKVDAITNGQACVIYMNDIIALGGIIDNK